MGDKLQFGELTCEPQASQPAGTAGRIQEPPPGGAKELRQGQANDSERRPC